MEKTLRYLLITFAVMMVLSVSAQGLAEQPQVGFQSTSSMVGSGSTLPQAATTGTYTTYDMGNARANKPGIRKGADEGDTPPDNPPGPNENPIGDAALPLALLALVYGVWCRVYKRKRSV